MWPGLSGNSLFRERRKYLRIRVGSRNANGWEKNPSETPRRVFPVRREKIENRRFPDTTRERRAGLFHLPLFHQAGWEFIQKAGGHLHEGSSLGAAVPAGVGQVKLVLGAGNAYIKRRRSSSSPARSPSSITRWCGNMPSHRPIRKTTDHSSPLAWWIVDRVTEPPEKSAAALSSSVLPKRESWERKSSVDSKRSENPARCRRSCLRWS